MNDHGAYPLLDSLTNDALLSTICHEGIKNPVSLYVDTKGYHLVWRQVKTNRNGENIWNGGSLLMETVSEDITAEFAKKLDYDGEAPDFTATPKDEDDDPRFAAAPEVDDGYAFAICGVNDDDGTHLTHIFATDGEHSQLLLASGNEPELASLQHMFTSSVLDGLPSEDVQYAPDESTILSMARELLK